jgi:hypothetical protein
MKFDPLPSTPARRRVRVPRDEPERAALEAWTQTHRGRPPIPPAPSVARATAAVLKPLAKKFGPGVADLDTHWREIVGDALARWCRPEKIQGGAAGRTLIISARGPAAALIEAQAGRILDRVAEYSGQRPARLKVVQGRLTGPLGARARGKPQR